MRGARARRPAGRARRGRRGRATTASSFTPRWTSVEVILVALLVSVVVLAAAAARRSTCPTRSCSWSAAACSGFVPGPARRRRWTRTSCCVVFLPPLLYSARLLREPARPAGRPARRSRCCRSGSCWRRCCVVAVVAHELIDGLSWPAAFALGAIVGPTDPVAATAIARRLGVPRRLVSVLEGEIAGQRRDRARRLPHRLAAAVAGAAFSLLDAGWDFLWKAAGGIALGLAVGWVIAEIRRRLDDPLIENTIGLLTGYAAYVPAETAAPLGGARGGHGRLLRRLAGAADRLARHAPAGLRDVGAAAVPAQRDPVRADRAAAAGDARRRSTATQAGRWSATPPRSALAVILTRIVWQNTTVYLDPARSTGASPARAPRRRWR